MYTWKKSFGAAFAGLALALAFTAQPAQGGIITYTSQAVFDAAFPGLTQQDFSAAKVADGNFGLMANPLDSSTNNAIFSPGDIKDGLRITVGPSIISPDNLFIAGKGFANYVRKAISYNGPDTPSPKMTVSFYNNNVNAFGLDLTSNPDGNTVHLELFSGAKDLGGITVNNVKGAGTFIGAFEDDLSMPITRVELNSPGNFFGFDNVEFGPASVPEPTSLALGAIGILGLYVGGRVRKWSRAAR